MVSLPVAQWLERPTGVRKVMGSIPVGDSDFFFVLRSRPKRLGLAFNEHGRTFRRSAVAHYVSSSKNPKPENVGGRSGKRRLQTQKKKKK